MSKICASCGSANADNAVNCASCGAMLDNNQGAPMNQPYNAQPYGMPMGGAPMGAPMAPPTSIGGWIGWLILCSFLPVIGQLIMLTSKDESTKNYAKAQLILTLIGIILMILLTAVIGVSFNEILQSM